MSLIGDAYVRALAVQAHIFGQMLRGEPTSFPKTKETAVTEATGIPLGANSTGRNAWLWSGRANNMGVQLITTDPELRPVVRPILTDRHIGVELVDPDGNQLACQVMARLDAPPSTVEQVPDPDELLREIRILAKDQGSPLAALVADLDEYLSSGGALPDAWHSPTYNDE